MSVDINPERLRILLGQHLACRWEVRESEIIVYVPAGYIRIDFANPERVYALLGENIELGACRVADAAGLAAFARKLWLGQKYANHI